MHNATVHLFTRNHFRFQTAEFTFHGLQRLIEISKHRDLSNTVLFGTRIRNVSLTQVVWSEEEAKAWFRSILKSKSLDKNRIMVEGALKARKLWRSHKNMLSQDLYLSMLTTVLQSVNGSGKFRGFNFPDLTPTGPECVMGPVALIGAIGEKWAMRGVYLLTSLEK